MKSFFYDAPKWVVFHLGRTDTLGRVMSQFYRVTVVGSDFCL